MPPVITELRRVITQVGWLIFILVTAQSSLDHWITGQMQNFLADPQGTSPMIYLYALFSIICALMFSSLLTVMVVSALQKNWVDATENLNQVLIETLRSWGRIIKWSFLLILPGMVKLLRLSFVPFVVLLSPAYKKGTVDALDESEKLAHGELFSLLIVFVVMTGILPIVLTSFDEFKIIWRTPVASLLYHLVEAILAVIFCLWLLRIYRRRAAEENP